MRYEVGRGFSDRTYDRSRDVIEKLPDDGNEDVESLWCPDRFPGHLPLPPLSCDLVT